MFIRCVKAFCINFQAQDNHTDKLEVYFVIKCEDKYLMLSHLIRLFAVKRDTSNNLFIIQIDDILHEQCRKFVGILRWFEFYLIWFRKLNWKRKCVQDISWVFWVNWVWCFTPNTPTTRRRRAKIMCSHSNFIR